MKKLVFLMLAILLINVSYAAEGQMEDVNCKNTIHSNRDKTKASQEIEVKDDEGSTIQL